MVGHTPYGLISEINYLYLVIIEWVLNKESYWFNCKTLIEIIEMRRTESTEVLHKLPIVNEFFADLEEPDL